MTKDTIEWTLSTNALPPYSGKILVSRFDSLLEFPVVDVAYFRFGEFWYDPMPDSRRMPVPDAWANMPSGIWNVR
jgi:hypothetical protein